MSICTNPEPRSLPTAKPTDYFQKPVGTNSSLAAKPAEDGLEAKERELREKLEGLVRDWDWGESNSLYGLDENGNKIPMRGGTECAKELRALLASHWPAAKEKL